MVGWFSLWRRPLRPICPFFKRFGLTNVQLLNSCTGWTKHILRALPPTDTFGVAAFVWISLVVDVTPKAFGALGARLMSCIFHAWFQILEPPFANIITVSHKMLRPCCRYANWCAQRQRHYSDYTMLTILSWSWSYISTHHPSWDWGWTTNRPGYTIGVRIVSSVNFGVVRLSWLMKMAILRQNMCDVQCASDRNPEFCLTELFQIICIIFFLLGIRHEWQMYCNPQRERIWYYIELYVWWQYSYSILQFSCIVHANMRVFICLQRWWR